MTMASAATQENVWHPSVRAAFIAWGVLMVSTLVSWMAGSGTVVSSGIGAAAAVMAVAYIKIRVVGLYFMELKDSPPVLRTLFEGYCLIVLAGILAIYLFL